MTSGTQFEYFATCAPGLESILLAELTRLGVPGDTLVGGVRGRTNWGGLFDVHLGSAVAESVRVRLKSFEATSFQALESGLRRLPWHAFLRRGQPVEVSVTCHKSKLYHSDAVKERALRVIEKALAKGRAPENALPPAKVFIRLLRDVVTPSIDASGERLHRRGYRAHVEDAPLRETLAAAMVQLLAGLSAPGASPATVWDPFCGSGVLPLEWLRNRRGQLPGTARSFAFESWPTFPPAEWQVHRERAQARDVPPGNWRAWGSDLDQKAVASAQSNAARAELTAATHFFVEDFRSAVKDVPRGAAVLSNPPYGKRLGSKADAQRLYRDLARTLLERPDLRPAVLACPDPTFLRASDGFRILIRTRHGGLPLAFMGLS